MVRHGRFTQGAAFIVVYAVRAALPALSAGHHDFLISRPLRDVDFVFRDAHFIAYFAFTFRYRCHCAGIPSRKVPATLRANTFGQVSAELLGLKDKLVSASQYCLTPLQAGNPVRQSPPALALRRPTRAMRASLCVALV